METKEVSKTKVITGKVRLSYAHVWEPAAIGDSKEVKYSAALLIPKTDTVTIDKINAAVAAAKEAGKSKWGGKIPAKLKLPLRDGDEEKPDDDAYAGCYFLNATSKSKPGIVDLGLKEIDDESKVYSGSIVKASLNFYAFDNAGNRGIAVGLNNLLLINSGEPLAGGSSAQDDFADIDLSAEIDDDDI